MPPLPSRAGNEELNSVKTEGSHTHTHSQINIRVHVPAHTHTSHNSEAKEFNIFLFSLFRRKLYSPIPYL